MKVEQDLRSPKKVGRSESYNFVQASELRDLEDPPLEREILVDVGAIVCKFYTLKKDEKTQASDGRKQT